MTPAQRAQRWRQEAESAGISEEELLVAAAELVRDLSKGRRNRVTGEFHPRANVPPKLDAMQAAEYLGVSPRTINGWVYKGRLKGKKYGRLRRFTHEELEQIRPLRRKNSSRTGAKVAPT